MSPLPQAVIRVPNVEFRNLNYLAQMPYSWVPRAENYTGPQPYYFDYTGPSDDLLRASNAVASNGEILSIPSAGINATWSLEFYGPSLECNDAGRNLQTPFVDDLARYLRRSKNGGAQQQYGFIAWYPNLDANGTIQVPANANRSDPASLALYSDSAVIDVGSLVPAATVSNLGHSSTPLALMILTQPFGSSSDQGSDLGSKLRSCQLFNTTYRVLFNYTNGNQEVNVTETRDPADGPV